MYLFDRFSSHPSLSKEGFSKNLQLWHSVLPEGNLLPTSYQEAYKVIKPYIVPEVIFHVCVNDCVLYRGELKNCGVCPKCSEPRFKAKNVLKRTFHYLPLSPKVIRSYGTGGISYLLLQSHGGEIGEPNNVGIMKDIHDSPKWIRSFSVRGILNGDSRGIALSLHLDGLNPGAKTSATIQCGPLC